MSRSFSRNARRCAAVGLSVAALLPLAWLSSCGPVSIAALAAGGGGGGGGGGGTSAVAVDPLALYVDENASGAVDAGDLVVIGFSTEVVLDPGAVGPLAPSAVLRLLVNGDSFGAGAVLRPGPLGRQISVVLGTAPVLAIAGTYAGGGAGSPSGLEVLASFTPTNALVRADDGSALRVAANALDLAPGFASSALAALDEGAQVVASGIGLAGGGALDVALAGRDALAIWRGDGAGGFTRRARLALAAPAVALVAGDVDGDDDLDLVSASAGQLTLWRGNGSGGFVPQDFGSASAVVDLALLDQDGNGASDALVVAQRGTASQLYRVQAGSFVLVVGNPLGSAAIPCSDLATGDLDEDGRADLAFAADDERVRVWFASGSVPPSFAPGPELATSGVGAGPRVAIGDLDGFLRRDLALVSASGVLHGFLADSVGGFTASTTVALGPGRASAIALGELDGGGGTELLVARADAPTQAYDLRVSGIDLTAKRWGPALSDGGDDARAVELADLDGDGDGASDVLIACAAGGDLAWRNLGNAQLERFGVGTIVADLAAGDFDGDALTDLLLATSNGLLYLPRTPSGGFAATAIAIAAGDFAAVRSADFDRDGKPDVAAAGSLGALVLRGLGSGMFLPLPPIPSGDTRRLAVGDLNGDGILDLATDSDELWLGTGSGTFGSSAVRLGLAGVEEGALLLADLDRDGDLDLAAADVFAARLLVRENDGRATFTDRLSVPIDAARAVVGLDLGRDGALDLVVGGSAGLSVLRAQLTPFAYLEERIDGDPARALAVLDFDGDGTLDLAAGTSAGTQLRRGSALGLDAVAATCSARDVRALLALRLDRDGATDLAVGGGAAGTSAALRSAKTAALLRPLALSTEPGLEGRASAETLAVALGDLDGDGALDLVLGRGVGDDDLFYLGDGAGGFGAPFALPAATKERGAAVALGDLDRDGDLDLLIGEAGQAASRIWRNEGGASFALSNEGLDSGLGTEAVLLFDFDRNGYLDALLGGPNGVRLHLHRGASATASDLFAPPFLLDASPVRALAAGDLDRDGDLDLVLGRTGLADRVLRGDGLGGFVAAYDFGAAFDTNALALGDLDGDGDLELLQASDDEDEDLDKLWDLSITSAVRRAVLFDTERSRAAALDDLDGDGVPELLLAEARGASCVFRSTDGASYARVSTGLGDEARRALASGDLDRDGRLDLLFGLASGPAARAALAR